MRTATIQNETGQTIATVTWQGERFHIQSEHHFWKRLDGKTLPLRTTLPQVNTDMNVDFTKEVQPTDPAYLDAVRDLVEQEGHGINVTESENEAGGKNP
jgi:hypothetical protein